MCSGGEKGTLRGDGIDGWDRVSKGRPGSPIVGAGQFR